MVPQPEWLRRKLNHGLSLGRGVLGYNGRVFGLYVCVIGDHFAAGIFYLMGFQISEG
jgi:hypothetical protein